MVMLQMVASATLLLSHTAVAPAVVVAIGVVGAGCAYAVGAWLRCLGRQPGQEEARRRAAVEFERELARAQYRHQVRQLVERRLISAYEHTARPHLVDLEFPQRGSAS